MTFSRFLVMLLFAISVMLGCQQQAPILVFVTPTPAEANDTLEPTNTVEALPTDTPASITQQVEGTATNTPISIGSVADANYQLRASNTPRPTQSPVFTPPPRPSATFTNAVTSTSSPTATSAPPTATSTPTTPPPASPTPLPKLNRDLMGLQISSNLSIEDWGFYLSRAKETGVGWVKTQLNWSFLQPNGFDPEHSNLLLFEQNIEAAKREGFKVLISIAKAPAWARPSGQADAPPDDPQALADFITMILTQTKIGANIDAIEVWNEPNLRREWNTSALPFSGAGYMQLFAPSYNAIRAVNPGITIVTAGLAPTSNIEGASIDDRIYLRQMYQAGLANYTDVAVGIHPYSWGNTPDERCCDLADERGWDDDPHFFFMDTIEDSRAIINEFGHQVPLWVTEFGWAVWEDIGGPLPAPEENNIWMTYTTLDQQVDYTIRAFQIGQERGDIGMMSLWNLNFANEFTINNREEVIAYSLLFPDENGPFKQGELSVRARPLFYLLPFSTMP